MKFMKGSFKYLTLLLLMVGGLAACKHEDLVLDPPASKLDGINDDFSLVEVVQLDPQILGGGNTYDVTKVYTTGVAPVIAFKSADFTYTYAAGNAPNYLGASGTWSFDNNDYPTLIHMNDGTSQFDLTLLHTIRPQDEFLEVQYARSCGSTVAIIYQFKFARIQ